MNIPNLNNPKWQELILNHEGLELKSLAFQMVIIRTKERLKKNEINIENAVEILHSFCVENQKGENLMSDLKNIFGNSFKNIQFTKKSQKLEETIDNNNDFVVFDDNLLKFKETLKQDTPLKNTESTLEEKEKLLQKLESLNNKVKEIEENKKKKKGFFKRLF